MTIGPTCWKLPDASLGSSVAGGRLICKSGGVGWIVAPNTTEVSRTWYCRNDAVTTAQSTSGCTGWFVPTLSQLQNPGYSCRTYWDSYSNNRYWSSTEYNGNYAFSTHLMAGNTSFFNKGNTYCVRAFRCVTY